MMTLTNFPNQKPQPMKVEGPYRRKTISFNEFLISAIGHIAIAGILIYSLLGMAGAWD